MKMPFRYGCVVDGEYFCPRPELERQLRSYAESGQNLVIQGERRMGKTSLVKKAISGMKGERLLYIDLYGIRTLSDFCRRVMSGVGGVTEKMSFLKKALSLAHRLRPALTIDSTTGAPTIVVDARAASEPDSLGTVMATVKKLAEDGGLCVVMDEFQDLLKLEDSAKILAEMRGTIQFQADTPYFYLGSSRNDMLRIFTHYDSPFFKSALPFEVSPIDEAAFVRFIVSRFRKGGCEIAAEVARSRSFGRRAGIVRCVVERDQRGNGGFSGGFAEGVGCRLCTGEKWLRECHSRLDPKPADRSQGIGADGIRAGVHVRVHGQRPHCEPRCHQAGAQQPCRVAPHLPKPHRVQVLKPILQGMAEG